MKIDLHKFIQKKMVCQLTFSWIMDSSVSNFRRPMIATNVPSSITSASSNAKSIYNRAIENESTIKIQFYRKKTLSHIKIFQH